MSYRCGTRSAAGEHHADEPAFLVRVDGVVPVRHHAAESGQHQLHIERNLRQRRTDPDAANERRPRAAKDAQAGHLHVVTERIGDEIDLMAEGRQRADAMKLAEGRSTRLEERLRRDHQNAQDAVIFS